MRVLWRSPSRNGTASGWRISWRNFGEPFSRVKFASSMKKENAFAPAKNTVVSPRIFVFHTLPCFFVRSSVNANGLLRNANASPKYGRPVEPGGGVVIARA